MIMMRVLQDIDSTNALNISLLSASVLNMNSGCHWTAQRNLLEGL